jgi:hypothetical protein
MMSFFSFFPSCLDPLPEINLWDLGSKQAITKTTTQRQKIREALVLHVRVPSRLVRLVPRVSKRVPSSLSLTDMDEVGTKSSAATAEDSSSSSSDPSFSFFISSHPLNSNFVFTPLFFMFFLFAYLQPDFIIKIKIK